MRELAYLDFDLLIERAGPDYRVRVVASPAGETRAVSFQVPFSDFEVENFLLRIGRPRICMSAGLTRRRGVTSAGSTRRW